MASAETVHEVDDPCTPQKSQPVMDDKSASKEDMVSIRKRHAEECARDDEEARAKRRALEQKHRMELLELESQCGAAREARERSLASWIEQLMTTIERDHSCCNCGGTQDLEACRTCSKSLCRQCFAKFQEEATKDRLDAYGFWKRSEGKSCLLKVRQRVNYLSSSTVVSNLIVDTR